MDDDLHRYAQQGDVQKLLSCLEQGADPNGHDPTGKSLLMEAAFARGLPTARLLLEAGANVNAQDQNGHTSLHWAMRYSPLARPDPEFIKLLLAYGADPDLSDAVGQTPLMWAAALRLLEIARILLEAGAQVNAQAQGGPTALMDAVLDNNGEEPDPRLVQLLLSYGADPNLKMENGWFVLMGASLRHNLETVRCLLEAGADPNMQMPEGSIGLCDNALKYAVVTRDLPILGALLAAGADINRGAESALILAVREGDAEVVQALVNAGADVTARTPDGKTVLQIAREQGHDHLLQILREAGAR